MDLLVVAKPHAQRHQDQKQTRRFAYGLSVVVQCARPSTDALSSFIQIVTRQQEHESRLQPPPSDLPVHSHRYLPRGTHAQPHGGPGLQQQLIYSFAPRLALA